MTNPIDYSGAFSNNPVQSYFGGLQAGLNEQSQRQNLEMNAAREARAQELHPLAVQGASTGVQSEQFKLDQAQEAAQRRDAFNADFAEVSQLGPDAGFDDYKKLAAQYPEFSKSVMDTYSALDEEKKSGMSRTFAQAINLAEAGEVDTAQEMMGEYATAYEAAGDAATAASIRAGVKLFEADPDAALGLLKSTLAVTDPDLAKTVIGENTSIQRTEPIGDGTVGVQYMRDGSTRVIDVITNQPLQGDEAREAIKRAQGAEATARGDIKREEATAGLESQIDLGGQVKAVEGMGAMQADFVKQAVSDAGNIAKGMTNIENAIQALKDGAKAGLIYKRVPDITKASADLRNSMDRMGLDVIGSVTFGALSGPELDLAMNTAVPRNLDSKQLQVWLSEKLDAQKKVRAALIEQAQFLSDPNNTVQDWAEQLGVEKDDADPLARFFK